MSLLSLAFLAVAVWIVAADRLDPSSSTTLLIDDPQWRSWLTAAGAAAAVAAYLGIASLETAAAMRVLSPDHALPARQPSILRIADPGVALAGLPLRSPLEWPASALPAPFGAVQALRCTVLIPAYNEELVLDQALRSLREQTRPADRVLVVADNCTDATVEVARR